MKIRNILLSAMAFLAFTSSAHADNIQNSAPAVQGYDVVSYHTDKRPIRGNGNFIAEHNGATYQFSNKKNLKKFNSAPEKYAPAYGGFCAFGVSVGKKFIGDPEVWRVVNNKLYLNLDTGIQDMWLKDVPGRIKTADAKWQKIKDKSPASL